MANYSDAASLMWHIAAEEAASAGFPVIEMSHFFIGLCKICDLPFAQALADAPQKARNVLPMMEAEIEEARALFRALGIDPKRFRRRLRGLTGSLAEVQEISALHRSPESRDLCALAEAIVAQEGGVIVFPLHLLYALAENSSGAVWEPLLHEHGLTATVFRSAAREALYRRATDYQRVPPQEEGIGG